MPAFIAGRNWLDEPGVTLTASSAAPSLPVSNLLTPMRAEVWRTDGTANPVLNVDLGRLRAVRAVVLAAPRDGLLPEGGRLAQDAQSLGLLTESGNRIVAGAGTPESGAIIEARLGSSATGGSDAGLIRAPFAMPLGYWCWVLPMVTAARYLRLTMTGSLQPYRQGGRLWVCDGLLHTPFHSDGEYEPAMVDTTSDTVRHRAQFTLSRLMQDEADVLQDIGIAVGLERQALLIPRTERADRTAIIGRFTDLPAPRPRQSWRQTGQEHTATLTMMEDR